MSARLWLCAALLVGCDSSFTTPLRDLHPPAPLATAPGEFEFGLAGDDGFSYAVAQSAGAFYVLTLREPRGTSQSAEPLKLWEWTTPGAAPQAFAGPTGIPHASGLAGEVLADRGVVFMPDFGNPDAPLTVFYFWDGTTWTHASLPDGTTPGPQLRLWVRSATSALLQRPDGLQRWDGQSWTPVVAPAPGAMPGPWDDQGMRWSFVKDAEHVCSALVPWGGTLGASSCLEQGSTIVVGESWNGTVDDYQFVVDAPFTRTGLAYRLIHVRGEVLERGDPLTSPGLDSAPGQLRVPSLEAHRAGNYGSSSDYAVAPQFRYEGGHLKDVVNAGVTFPIHVDCSCRRQVDPSCPCEARDLQVEAQRFNAARSRLFVVLTDPLEADVHFYARLLDLSQGPGVDHVGCGEPGRANICPADSSCVPLNTPGAACVPTPISVTTDPQGVLVTGACYGVPGLNGVTLVSLDPPPVRLDVISGPPNLLADVASHHAFRLTYAAPAGAPLLTPTFSVDFDSGSIGSVKSFGHAFLSAGAVVGAQPDAGDDLDLHSQVAPVTGALLVPLADGWRMIKAGAGPHDVVVTQTGIATNPASFEGRIAPDGRTALLAEGTGAALYDTEQGRRLGTVPGPIAWSTVHFAGAAPVVVSGDIDPSIGQATAQAWRWDSVTGTAALVFGGFTTAAGSFASPSADGRFIAQRVGDGISLFDLSSGTTAHKALTVSWADVPDLRAASGGTGAFASYHPFTAPLPPATELSLYAFLPATAGALTQTLIATGIKAWGLSPAGTSVFYWDRTLTLQRWDVATGLSTAINLGPTVGAPLLGDDPAFTFTGRWMFFRDASALRVFDLSTGNLTRSIPGSWGVVFALGPDQVVSTSGGWPARPPVPGETYRVLSYDAALDVAVDQPVQAWGDTEGATLGIYDRSKRFDLLHGTHPQDLRVAPLVANGDWRAGVVAMSEYLALGSSERLQSDHGFVFPRSFAAPCVPYWRTWLIPRANFEDLWESGVTCVR